MAEQEDAAVFEGVHYFSIDTIDRAYIAVTERVFHCPRRGYGVYADLRVDEKTKADGAVYFAHPYPEAKEITDRVCFLYGVEIVD